MTGLAGFDLGPDYSGGPEGVDRSLLAHVLSLKPQGWAVEFGVGSGGTLAMIAAVMPVIGFGNTTGLTERWGSRYKAGSFKYPTPEVVGATVVPGDFANTVPGYDWPDEIGLIHFDADTYGATNLALDSLPPIEPNTLLVFDEWDTSDDGDPERGIEHEQRAFGEYVARTGLRFEVIGHGRQQAAFRVIA